MSLPISSQQLYNEQKLLHFVWFGENITYAKIKEVQGLNWERLKNWAKSNSEHQVILWTDNTFSSSNIPPNLEIKNFDNFPFSHPSTPEVKEVISFLRNPPAPSISNFGAASDLARALVLHHFGGIYMDLDTKQRQSLVSLDELLAGKSIRLSMAIEAKHIASLGRLCNDVICCKVNSEIMDSYLRIYLERFKDDSTIKDDLVSTDKLDITTLLGPNLLRYLILTNSVDYKKINNRGKLRAESQAILVDETKTVDNFALSSEYYERGNDNSWFDREVMIPQKDEKTDKKLEEIKEDSDEDYDSVLGEVSIDLLRIKVLCYE